MVNQNQSNGNFIGSSVEKQSPTDNKNNEVMYDYVPYVMAENPRHMVDLTELSDNAGTDTLVASFVLVGREGTNLTWNGFEYTDIGYMKDYVDDFQRKGGELIISFGGEHGTYISEKFEGRPEIVKDKYQKVIDMYDVDYIDIDDEQGTAFEPTESMKTKAKALKMLKKENPDLKISYTLDGNCQDGLTLTRGKPPLEAAADEGLRPDKINVMVMGNSAQCLAPSAFEKGTDDYEQAVKFKEGDYSDWADPPKEYTRPEAYEATLNKAVDQVKEMYPDWSEKDIRRSMGPTVEIENMDDEVVRGTRKVLKEDNFGKMHIFTLNKDANISQGQSSGTIDPVDPSYRYSNILKWNKQVNDGGKNDDNSGDGSDGGTEDGSDVGTNQPPTASITADSTTISTGSSVTYTVSAEDSDGTLSSATIDTDDGTTVDVTDKETATHSYSKPGTYTAELTVTDDEGDTASDTATVEVTDSSGEDTSVEEWSPDNDYKEGTKVRYDGAIWEAQWWVLPDSGAPGTTENGAWKKIE
ncbi:MAG: PKD domain-containing protein [Halobacteria archaeon]